MAKRKSKTDKELIKIHNKVVEIMKEYPDAQFGAFINKQTLLEITAHFLNNPNIQEIFIDLQIRIPDADNKG